jgi:23S rRNA (uracil1939-C5)-methyltransferase
VPPGGFVQANRVVGLELARLVAEAAGPTPGRTVELYAGTGHLTVALLRVTESLLAIESDAAAAQALERNLAERGRADVQARRDDAAAALRGLDGTPELVVADPPRAGLETAAYEIVRLRPPRVILVSCELRALARDRRVLAREGYGVTRAVLLDMFHPTHRVEALTVFARPGAG